MRVKIIGAGSIGNHHAQACRRMGWEVDVVDKDKNALLRMKNEVYPQRYGSWDSAIGLFSSENEPKGGYDIIMNDVPPDYRMQLAIHELAEKPRLLHLEKPLSTPSIDGMAQLKIFEMAVDLSPEVKVVVGYNHAVSEAAEKITQWIIEENKIGPVFHIGIEWREHWGGIFAAHPWLKGPEDSYLGFWRRGGGAACEHSHGLHLWVYFANLLRWGHGEADSLLIPSSSNNGSVAYDNTAVFLFHEKSGKNGFVVQDVVTKPTKKTVKFIGANGSIEWLVNGSPKGDVVILESSEMGREEVVLEKTRRDDFYKEICHYDDILSGKVNLPDSPLRYGTSKKVMEFLHQAFSPLEPH